MRRSRLRPHALFHHKPKVRVTHFGHRPSEHRRPVAMNVVGDMSLGELAGATDGEKDRQLVARLREAGEIIAEYCRRIADTRSRRIPMSLSVKNDAKSVYILGGGPAAPNAYPFDPPSNPPVAHPVYGRGPRKNWTWADQPYFPFLEMGAEAGGDAAAEAFANIIDDWAKEIGSDRP